MAILTINEVNEVDLEEMQALHKKEIDLMNQIDETATACVRGDADVEELVKTLEEYVANVKEHFEYEEELMEKHDFISYDMHKMAHEMFMADLNYAIRHWRENGDLNKIVAFVRKAPEWLASHIETVDAPTAEYLAKKL